MYHELAPPRLDIVERFGDREPRRGIAHAGVTSIRGIIGALLCHSEFFGQLVEVGLRDLCG